MVVSYAACKYADKQYFSYFIFRMLRRVMSTSLGELKIFILLSPVEAMARAQMFDPRNVRPLTLFVSFSGYGGALQNLRVGHSTACISS